MKILLVVHDFDFFWIHKSRLAKEIQKQGAELHVLGPTAGFGSAKEAKVEKAAEAGIDYLFVPFDRRGTSPFRESVTLWKLFRRYRQLKPDLVHHLTMKPVIYGSIAARFAGVPKIVNSITGLGYVYIAQDWFSRPRRMLVNALYKFALGYPRVRTIFENADDRDFFIKSGITSDERNCVIPGGGVDLAQFAPAPEPAGAPVIVLPARMLWDKGVGEFVDAVRILKKEGHSFKALLVGPLETANPTRIPEDQLRKWESEGLVEWTGFQENMTKVYRESHIVCLPSYREGGALVLVEALASGRPIVTTDVPGCRNVVMDGVNGFSVPAKEAEPLAQALRKLIVDADLRKRLGRNGRQLAEEKFASAVIDRQTFNVYGLVPRTLI